MEKSEIKEDKIERNPIAGDKCYSANPGDIVNFIANNHLVNAVSNVGGIVSFLTIFKKHFIGVGKILGRALKIGINSVTFLSAYTTMKLNNNRKNKANYYKKRHNFFVKK